MPKHNAYFMFLSILNGVILETLLPLRHLVKGSVYDLHTRCGKPSCHCASDQGPLHTSTVISWSAQGKTRLRTLPAGELAHFRHSAENYRRFRHARAMATKEPLAASW